MIILLFVHQKVLHLFIQLLFNLYFKIFIYLYQDMTFLQHYYIFIYQILNQILYFILLLLKILQVIVRHMRLNHFFENNLNNMEFIIILHLINLIFLNLFYLQFLKINILLFLNLYFLKQDLSINLFSNIHQNFKILFILFLFLILFYIIYIFTILILLLILWLYS